MFAPDESQNFKDGFMFKTGKACTTVNVNWLEEEKQMWIKCDRYFDDFDIIHGHNWMGFEYASKVRNNNIKVCHTMHGHLNYDWWGKPAPFKLNLIAISCFMKQMFDTGYNGQAPKIPSEVAYNGIDLDLYQYKKDKGDRLMFLGRIDPIKAPHAAIEVANKSGHGIDIVGGTSFVVDLKYVEDIKKKCMQGNTSFIGEVDHQTKLKYLQNAKALIIPSHFGEPFGLIACEAMAVGCIPIALNDGALSEIIENGKSGFICNNLDEMVDAVKNLDKIDRKECVKRAEMFSKERMAERYEFLYRDIVENGIEW